MVNRLAEQGLRAQLSSEPAARRDISYTTTWCPRRRATRRWATPRSGSTRLAADDAAAGALGGDRAVVRRRDPGARWSGRPGGPQAAGRPGPTRHARHPGARAPSSRGRGRARRTSPTDRSRWRSTSTWPASSTCAPAANCASAADDNGNLSTCPAGGVRVVPPRRPHEWHLGHAATAAAGHRTVGDGEPFVPVGVVAQSALDKRAAEGWPVQSNWRYRLGADRVDARELDQLIDGLQVMQRTGRRTSR